MIPEILSEILKILLMVFTLMVLVKYLKLRFKATIRENILKKPLDNYTDSSFFGSKMGFSGISSIFFLYVHGMVDFGSLDLSMMANVGDEAFSMDSRMALLIFAICLLLGMIAGFLANRIFRRIKFYFLTISRTCFILRPSTLHGFGDCIHIAFDRCLK